MDEMLSTPGARRDNAGYVSVPATVPRGCRGPSCPAFAMCQGRCAVRKPEREVPEERRG
jgi:hypothetical protein